MINNKNRKRVAALVRLLASDNKGEVDNCIGMLKKVCNLNDLGNEIEKGKSNNSLSKEQMQELYDAGLNDGYIKGKKDGIEEGKKFAKRNTFEEVPDSDEQLRVLHCNKHKERLKTKDREFVDNMVNWSTVLNKPLTPAQGAWLNSIYKRLGGT
jgi:hypothetical protein